MTDRPITSAQRLAARALDVPLPPPDTDPRGKAASALEAAARQTPGGWSAGGPDAVVKASRGAIEARRSRNRGS